MVLQASLQHVVLTYDPVNGRQIFVNGQDTMVTDPQKGGTISQLGYHLRAGARQRSVD